MVAKLTDVAELAGVSPTTVSRVINKKGYLSEKTIQKVKDAMRELGYKPNNLARSLQGKSAKLIGLIFPKISHVFYAELIDKLEHELFKKGYKTIICNSEHDSEKEREYLEMIEANPAWRSPVGELELSLPVIIMTDLAPVFSKV